MSRRVLFICVLALIAAAPAWAHAIVLGSDPANGAVLASSPTTADVQFDDPVRVGTRNAAIRNEDGKSVLGGKPFVRQSRTLVIPLQPNLPDGNYTVRWSIVSDDGHNEEGVIAFGVGAGGETPTAELGTRGSVTWQQVAMRGRSSSACSPPSARRSSHSWCCDGPTRAETWRGATRSCSARRS